MTDREWAWELVDSAEKDLHSLTPNEQDRITSKLDAIVTDEWRDPDDYLEPLTGAPHSKLKIGPFRLGCELDRDNFRLIIISIEKRSGAYKPGDD